MKLPFNIIFIFYIKYNDLLSNLLLNSSYCPSEKDYFHLIFSLLNIIAGSRGMVSAGATSAKSFVQTVKQNYKMYFINWIAHGGGQKGVNTRLQFCSCSVWHFNCVLAEEWERDPRISTIMRPCCWQVLLSELRMSPAGHLHDTAVSGPGEGRHRWLQWPLNGRHRLG